MTTIEHKHFRSLEVLIQSRLAELTGAQRGLVVVVPTQRSIDVYSTVGSGIDVRDSKVLRQLPWIKVTPDQSGWTFTDLGPDEIAAFLPE